MKLSKDEQLKDALDEIKHLQIGAKFLKSTRDLYYEELTELKTKRSHALARSVVTWIGILAILTKLI